MVTVAQANLCVPWHDLIKHAAMLIQTWLCSVCMQAHVWHATNSLQVEIVYNQDRVLQELFEYNQRQCITPVFAAAMSNRTIHPV